ncbi:hypothetical protein DER46DRAFT_665773 [Fusarium sp. MPI-SDFR-AT-0072]|nr:hypothetical protein DER46DRAFT_665773 [Fusarium sp. MPI-SDFR-AT-0072]
MIPSDKYMKRQLAAVEGGVPLRETKFFPPGQDAGTPSSFDVVTLDYTSARLKWSPTLDALGYRVYYGSTANASLSASMTEGTVGDLIPSTTCEISLTAIGGDGKESEHSNSKTITTLPLPNGQPVGNYSSTLSETPNIV